MSSSRIYRARNLGREAGAEAAAWVFDGRTSEDTYRRVLRGIEDCDPEIMDAYREPDLSGEWAGSYTVRDLAADLGILPYSDLIDECADAYLQEASAAFWQEIERTCRVHVPPDIFTRRRDAIAYLTRDGAHLRTPCSRYGNNAGQCAPVAWRLAYLCAREQGEPVTREALDHSMSLVVNDHDDVRDVITMLGRGWYGR